MVFGYGTHFWLEVPLVKLEGQVVILRLILERLRHLALDNSDRPLEPIPSTSRLRVTHLPLRFVRDGQYV
jgi:cytochrome P450